MTRLTSPVAPLQGVSVFIVEDDPLIAMCLTEMLEDSGATVVAECYTLKTAMQEQSSLEFDLAIVDVRLGKDISSEVVSAIHRRGIPIVMATGDPEQIVKYGFPATTVIGKPYVQTQIVGAALKALSRTTP